AAGGDGGRDPPLVPPSGSAGRRAGELDLLAGDDRGAGGAAVAARSGASPRADSRALNRSGRNGGNRGLARWPGSCFSASPEVRLMKTTRLWLGALLLAGACGGSTSAKRSYGGSSPPPAEPGNQGDRHNAVGTNPFVSAAHNPFSTFGADVDTASYDIFRRDVQQGMLPRADGVRLEEYVN